MNENPGGVARRVGTRARKLLPALVLPFVVSLAVSCIHDETGGDPSGGSGVVYGSFVVASYEAFPPYWDRHAAVVGRLYDGVVPEPYEWAEQAVSGSCRVIKPVAPFCDTACGSGAVCSAGGVCVAYPKALSAGKVSVNGIGTASGATSFIMNPVLGLYQPSGISLAFPPYAEGAPVTFTASGSGESPRFSLSARGPALPMLLNDSIVLDGNPVVVRWTPPGAGAGPTSMQVSIDISHHGGLKGTIDCATEDDGEVEIAGALVNELKALGVSGFPQIDLVRRTSKTLEGHGVSLVLEARVLKYVTVPGVSSCREDEDCPGGQACQPDFKCQ